MFYEVIGKEVEFCSEKDETAKYQRDESKWHF